MAGSMDVTIIMRAVDQASSVISGVRESLLGTDGAMKNAAAGSAALAGGLMALAAGMGAVVAAGFVQNSQLENQEIKWTQLTGSTEGAAEAQAMFRKIQQESPFDNQSIDQFITQMYGMGMGLDEAAAAYQATGNTAAAYGLNQEQLNRFLTATTQAYGKGKLQAEEMNQMTEAGIPITSILGEMMGKTSGEIRDMGANGEITKDILDEAFLYMDKKYAGSMEAFSQTWGGMLGRAQESLMMFAGLLTTELFAGASKMLGPAVDAFEEFINKMIQVKEEGGSVAEHLLKMIPPEVIPAIAAVSGALLVGLVPAVYAVATGIWAMMAPLIPFLVAGAALGALAYYIYDNWAQFKPFFMGIFNAVKPVITGFVEVAKESFSKLMSHIQPIWEQIKRLMVSLGPILEIVGVTLGVLLVIAMAVFNGVVAAIGPVITAFLAIVDTVVNVVTAIIKLLTGDMQGAQDAWARAVESTKQVVVSIWEAIVNFITGFVETIMTILRNMGANVPTTMSAMWTSVKTTALNAWNALKAYIAVAIAAIITNVVTFGAKVISSISGAFNKAKAVASSVWSGIKSLISSAISAVITSIVKFGSKVVSTFTTAFNRAKSVASSVWNAIKSLISSAIKAVVTAIVNFGKKVITTFTTSFNKAKSVATTVWNAIKTFVQTTATNIVTAIKTMGTNVVTSVRNAFSDAKSAVVTKLGEMLTAIKNKAKDFLTAGKGLITALGDGIKSAFNGAKTAVSNGLGAIRKLLPGSDAEEGPLSDLTKSGAALFPTFAKGIAKNASDAAMAAKDGINDVAGQLSNNELGQTAMFNGGKAQMIVTHKYSIDGTVNVKGDTSEESVKFVASRVGEKMTDEEFLKSLRQEVRKR